MTESNEIDGGGYTVRPGKPQQWGDFVVSIPFEWVALDETGMSSGPIRNGRILGGRYDGTPVKMPKRDPGLTIQFDPKPIIE